jgi:plastocyanin
MKMSPVILKTTVNLFYHKYLQSNHRNPFCGGPFTEELNDMTAMMFYSTCKNSENCQAPFFVIKLENFHASFMRNNMKYHKFFLTRLASLMILSAVLVSCGKKPEETSNSSAQTQGKTETIPGKTAFPLNSESSGTISGKIRLNGTPPAPKELPVAGNPECKVFHPGKVYSEEILVKDGALKNAFIYIKEGLENYSFETAKEPVKIDQAKCIYVPHVAGAQVNQTVLFLNSDPTLHNIHSYAKENETWNFGMPFEGMQIEKIFPKPEIMITMKCDLHPWMTGYLGIVSHPYFAVTREDGSFEFKDLPPGNYVIEAWHEKLGTLTQNVTLGSQEKKELQFSFDLSSNQ